MKEKLRLFIHKDVFAWNDDDLKFARYLRRIKKSKKRARRNSKNIHLKIEGDIKPGELAYIDKDNNLCFRFRRQKKNRLMRTIFDPIPEELQNINTNVKEPEITTIIDNGNILSKTKNQPKYTLSLEKRIRC